MPKILESEALALAQNIDTLSDAEKPLALDILKRYQAQQWDNGEPEWPTQARAQKEGDARFRSMFEDLKNVDKAAPSLADALQYSDNPDADRARVASIAYLSRVNDKPADEIGSSLDLYRNDYTTRRGQKSTDDLGFYKLAAAEVAAMKLKEDTALEGAKAALRGEDVIASLQAWQSKNLDRIPDSTEFTKGYLKAKEGAGDYLSIADELLKIMESGTGKSTRPFDSAAANRLDEIAGELATMKPRERKQVYASISARAEAAGYEQKGFWSQMLGQIDQGLFRMSQTVPQGMGSVLGTIGEFVGGEDTVSDREFRDRLAKERGEETTAEMKLRQEKLGEVQSEIAQIISGTVDPVKTTVGWIPDYLEAGAIKSPGAVLPFMTASAALGPYGAGLVFTADFAEQNRRDLVAAGLDRDDAARIGMMAAPLQAAVESLSNAFQLGKWASPIAPGSSFLKRYVTNSIASGATEFTEEQVQENIIRPIVQDVVGMIDANVPQIGFGEMWDKMKSDTPELISVLAPMALVFGGVMTNADLQLLQLSRDLTGNVDGLTALGYSSAQATEVIQATDEGGRIAKARELWGVRAGTKESMQSGAAKLSEKLRLLQSDASTAQAELERRGMLPRMLHAEEGNWRLTFNDGSVADFKTHNEANAARWSWAQDQLGEFHAITRETLASLEKNLDVGREVAVEFKPDARTAADAVKDGASREMIGRRVGQGKALGDVDAGTTYDEAMATDKAASIGDEFLSSLQILGSSKTEFLDGIMRTTIKLWEGSNVLTLVEEKLEGDAKAMMRTPQGRDWLLSRLRNYEQASGDKVFRDVADDQLQNDDIVEAWSHVGQSYLVGRSTFGEPLQGKAMRRFGRFLMRAGLGGAFNSESAFFAAVAGRAQKLMEAKKAGTLPADFTEELERQLGIDSQVKHDAGALQEAASIIDTGDRIQILEENGKPVETFSLRSGDFEARAAAMFSPFQRTPELRMVIARVAKERAMRLGAEWIEKAAVLRTSASISKEQAFREADSFDRRVNDYLESLTPAARQELEFEPATLEGDPLVSAMLDFGKLMSQTTAKKSGKIEAKSGDYDGQPWLPPAWFSKGAGIMPDQMAQAMNDAGLLPDAYTGTLWDALASRIESTRKDKAAHREAVQAYQDAKKQAKADAKAEAEAWATQAKKQAGSPKAQREMLKAALRTLDGILSAAPPEVRARVGGYVKLAGLATDEAMLQEIERRVAKLNVELEKWLTKQAREQLTRIFKKAKPKAEAGEKAKGKLTPEVHAWFALAEEASTLSPAAADERIEGIANSLSQEMTPAIKEELSRWLGRTVSDDAEAQDWQEQRMTILQTFGSVLYGTDAKPARGAGDTTAAFDLAKEVYTDGRLAHIEETAKKRERREADRGDGISRLGGPYDPEKATQRKKALNKLTGLKGRAADYLDTGLDASGFFLDLLGDGNLYENTRRNILEADMAKDDAMRKRKAEFAAMLTEVFPKKGLTDRLRGLWELQQIQTDSPVGTLSQLQAMQFTLWFQDMDSREWLESNGYGEEWQAKAEAWLTSEARGLRSWLMKQYAGQYDRINPVFRRLRGVNLPRVDVYGGKRQVEHSKADSSVALETDMMRGGMEAGFTKTRVSRPTGPPKITDALQNYWQNAHQVEHYIAFAETVTELKAVFGHRDFRLAVETNRGQDKAKQVSDWIANIEQAGSRDAFAHSAQGLLFGRYGKAVAASALSFKLSVLAKQAPAAIQSAFKVGLKEYFASLARVMSGKAAVSLGEMWRSETVQRRLSQHDVEMQQASKGWNQRHFENEIIDKVATTPDLLMNAGWYAIGWTDARFTTVSAAVAYDVAYRDARRLGRSEEEAKAFAGDEAALIVMETAQPHSVATKSLFENQTPMALLRFFFAFQSANRQVFGLTYLALKKGGVANAWGTAALIAGVVQTVGGLIRMMTTDDEPEELFKPEAYALGMATAPLTGMMGLGLIVEAIGNGVGVESRISASPVTMLPSAIKDIAEGDADVKDVSRSMSILGTVLGGRGAVLGVGWNVLNQLFGFYENAAD